MNKKISVGIAALIVFAIGFVCIAYYPIVFAKTVIGKVVDVKDAIQPTTIVQSRPGEKLPSQIFSFAVAIQNEKGDIMTASTEDRQWAVVQKGQCAVAKFFPYPPWNFAKWGTYFDARLLKLKECQ